MRAAQPGASVVGGRTVGEVMVTAPKTLPAGATTGDVRAVLADDHVHMVLLTDAGTLVGTLLREDVRRAPGAAPAVGFARLARRTVAPSASAAGVRESMLAAGARRLAVVDEQGVLLGLLCLKRRGTGFCSDRDVAARADASD